MPLASHAASNVSRGAHSHANDLDLLRIGSSSGLRWPDPVTSPPQDDLGAGLLRSVAIVVVRRVAGGLYVKVTLRKVKQVGIAALGPLHPRDDPPPDQVLAQVFRRSVGDQSPRGRLRLRRVRTGRLFSGGGEQSVVGGGDATSQHRMVRSARADRQQLLRPSGFPPVARSWRCGGRGGVLPRRLLPGKS